MTGGRQSDPGLPPGYPFRADWEVTPRALAEEMAGAEPPLLIDCRTEGEFEVARIEGSVLVPMSEIASRQEDLTESLDQRIVVHCHRGQRSLRVAAFLRSRGYTDVWSLAGGIAAWSQYIDPEVPQY